MKKYKRLLLATGLAGMACLAVVFMACMGRGAQPANGFAVVELFTSEGCSSCPPADALIARTFQQDRSLPVYILAFHVDYWDHQGWKDAFSNAAYSERQRQYARWLRLSDIYTPQVVVNGRTEMVGSDATSLGKAIQAGLQQAAGPTLTLSGLRHNGARLDWQYQIAGSPAAGGKQHLALVAALVEKNAVTKVNGGENNGRTLSHVQIVRALGMESPVATGKGTGHLEWPAGLEGSNAEVVVLLQDWGSGEILAASGVPVQQ